MKIILGVTYFYVYFPIIRTTQIIQNKNSEASKLRDSTVYNINRFKRALRLPVDGGPPGMP